MKTLQEVKNDKKVSESETENIFRSFHGADTFIEKSAIPTRYGFASKNRTDFKGFPDFFYDANGFLIVVEAKATCLADAEAEVSFYMENNEVKNSEDIIGIAIAGQHTREHPFKVSYFIKFAGKPVERLNVDTRLLLVDNLRKVYRKAKMAKFSGTLNDLGNILTKLNKRFQKDGKIRDTERSLFFSGLMIALKDNTFRSTYRGIQAPAADAGTKVTEAAELNESIIRAISQQLNGKINNHSKKFNWADKFSFIKTIDYSLHAYKEIIKTIEENIFIPFENEESLDILGKAYKIFLKRAGKVDNKNIILTPDHIKSLMVRLARLTVSDIVLDTCAGTGGFLMEAMEVMIQLAASNEQKIAAIKERQLIGFEIDPVLFALACSNMFLHGDGKTNLIFRSSLLEDTGEHLVNGSDEELLKYIRELRPTKVVINPPYESNKAIAFALQAIDYLEPNGKLIIIMPTPTLTFNLQRGYTKTLLEKATLDFVIRMPERLFSEQGRTVNTSIFGFTKTPHNKDLKVVFYDLSDDGFESVQHKGRVDKAGNWDEREDAVVNAVLNKEEIPGISKFKRIFDEDGVLIPRGVVEGVNVKDFVRLGDVFDYQKGKLASEKADGGEFAFVTASEEWKSHSTYTHDCEALVIAVAASGSLGRTHYVNGKFIASNLCLVLTPKKKWRTSINMRFMAAYINSLREDIRRELADGTSKLTIGDDNLADYLIKVPDKALQDEFCRNHIAPLDDAKRKLLKKLDDVECALANFR